MPKQIHRRRQFFIPLILVFLTAILAVCTPEGQAQETKPAVTQTIESPASTLTNEEIRELITKPMTPTPTEENTATPEASPTPDASPTLEATATPTTPEFPSDLVILPQHQVERGNLRYNEWGSEYTTSVIQLYIRAQDVHYNEPFTMLNGQYYVQAWADAWFKETSGAEYHVSVPLVVYDTKNYKLFRLYWPMVSDYSDREDESIKNMAQQFMGPWNENAFSEMIENDFNFGETGLYHEEDNSAYAIQIGVIPTGNITSNKYKNGIETHVEFWRDLIEGVYTSEKIEAFKQTLDVNFLSLDEPNLPINFIVPLRAN